MMVRAATAADWAQIGMVVRAAFGRDEEARLVDRLRADGEALVELVACEDDEVVGHILFSPLPIVGRTRQIAAAALAPLAVRPDRQRRGLGARLTFEALDACRAAGVRAVVVLGDPGYYRRFGFRAEIAANVRAPFSGPAFMALELEPGILAGGGEARYAAAFGV